MRRRHALFRFLCAGSLTAFALLDTGVAEGQTWSAPRSRPSIWQVVAVDGTGEMGWPFGVEDVARDGRDFSADEQAVDLRSAYATLDDARLWLRAYVSSPEAPHSSLRVYVFLDADGNRSTGGSAAATEVDSAFTTDPTDGGFDHVVAISGTGTVIGFWDWQEPQAVFQPNNQRMARTQAEAGTDVDPLRLGRNVRGYVGGSVELTLLAVTPSCLGTDLFFRAVSEVGSDLDVLPRLECGGDRNDNRVPDRIEDVASCQSDDGCPANGRCISGRCRFSTACAEDADCGAGRTCVDDRCVAIGGESCSSNAGCDGLVCRNNSCAPCTDSGASCTSGQACAPDGRCVPGRAGAAPDSAALVDAGERVQGGALTCGIGAASGSAGFFTLALSALLLLRRRNRRSIESS